MAKKEWQKYASILKNLFSLETSPVAVACIKGKIPKKPHAEKVRICRAILDASRGGSIYINKHNNICFGASWHLGFHPVKNPRLRDMFKRFTVEKELLFSSDDAAEKMFTQMEEAPDNADSYFVLAPAEGAEFQPQLFIFLVNPEEASRLLTLITFSDGVMPKIKLGGPTCRMAITYPVFSQEVNISFYDYTARVISKVKKDKLIVSVPYSRIPEIIKNIDRCSGGKAKAELSFKKSVPPSRKS